MRLHTRLTPVELYSVFGAHSAADVHLEHTRHGSRSHDHAFEVSLTGYGARHTRAKNTGTSASSRERAATWSDWGRFLAGVFERDPSAKCAYYANAEDYHAKTHGLFVHGALVAPDTLADAVRDTMAEQKVGRNAAAGIVAGEYCLPNDIVASAIFGE